MARHDGSRFLPLASVMIAALRLCGCVPAPSQPSLPPPPADTLALVTERSKFTYLEETYRDRQRDDAATWTTTWIVSTAGPTTTGADSIRWTATIIDDPHRNWDTATPITLSYKRGGDVIMQRYFRYNYGPGIVSSILPLSSHADIEMPPMENEQEESLGGHNYRHTAITRTTTCRYLGRDTIDVAGEHMACEHGMIEIRVYGRNIDGGDPGPSGNSVYGTEATEYWFAPKLGFIAKERVYVTDVRTGARSNNWVDRTLQSYTPG